MPPTENPSAAAPKRLRAASVAAASAASTWTNAAATSHGSADAARSAASCGSFPVSSSANGSANSHTTIVEGTPTTRIAAAYEPATAPSVRVSSGTAVSRSACAASTSVT